jgi:hypothetical protein
MPRAKSEVMTAERFLRQWLSGTTCHRSNVKRTIEWQRGPFVLLKHHGHSEYCGRGSGTAWCGTRLELHDMRVEYNFWCMTAESSLIKKWDGRWSAFRQRECCEIAGSLEK